MDMSDVRDARRHHRSGHSGTGGEVPGIVIADGRLRGGGSIDRPRISAFVWGRREPSPPTLPFGRWKADTAA